MKKLTVRFTACLLAVFMTAQSVSAVPLLIPVGQVVGLELEEGRVTIDGFDSQLGRTAQAAGLREGDRILTIDNTPIYCPQDVKLALQRSDGDVDMTISRGKATKELELEPVITNEGPKLGIYLRQGISGIGTVTYYDPESKQFAALGHGVNGKDGELIAMTRGFAYDAIVDAVKMGKSGDPGQLIGTVTNKMPIATLSKNTTQGVFGKTAVPFRGDALPTASVSEIRTGPASIRSTIKNGTVQEYSVEILKIYPHSSTDGRNMLLKVTDSRLLSATGGIVQGMSGSPIIQSGKIVGAVTHVLVNDPTTGYGIFIENMLDAAA